MSNYWQPYLMGGKNSIILCGLYSFSCGSIAEHGLLDCLTDKPVTISLQWKSDLKQQQKKYNIYMRIKGPCQKFYVFSK